ncbi:MAG: hypothetical protein K6C97_11775 [Treponema sp.]|nr:hypothetical protein [Treponema sp.]
MKKSLVLILSLITFLSASLFADGIPSWYSEEVTLEEKEITRKNSNGAWVPFIDRVFSASTFVKVDDKIASLEDARAQGEKDASEKLISYLKSKNETEALKIQPVMTSWSYNYSLADGGAYVQVQIKSSIEKPQPVVAKSDGNNAIEELSDLPRVLPYDSERFTLVDSITTGSQESIESHKLSITGSGITKTKEAFYYSNGILIYDNVYYIRNSSASFSLKNVVKGRRTLIVIRVDKKNAEEEMTLVYNNKSYKAKVNRSNEKNRWTNVVFEIEEGDIVEYSPKFTIKGSYIQNFASIYVYQLL